MKDIAIFTTHALDLSYAQHTWLFAERKRAEIDVYFARLKKEKPAVWNGRVLMLYAHTVKDGRFSGTYLETDFASFSFWRDQGRPIAGVYDCFGAAAILSADGAFLLGVMGAHTANAGHIYFPCGTPDLDDVVEGKVDLEASVARELKEETGYDISEFTAEPHWTTVIDGTVIQQVKLLRSRESAETLRANMLSYLQTEERPELANIRIVRGVSDFDRAMPSFVTAYLRSYFDQSNSAA
jgi:8-oxo-dGTP pyrophosphatase MutT (NUDIX family)